MDQNDDAVYAYYDPSSDQPLSDVVLEAIADVKGVGITKETCILYEDIDPTGLDLLFEESGIGNTVVKFICVDCEVTFRVNDEIEIRAALIPDEEK